MKEYYNPKTKEMEDLFDYSSPIFGIVAGHNAVIGDKGSTVRLIVEAENEEKAKEKALKNKEFIQHLHKEYIDKKYLSIYEPTGLYVIGRVEYFDGDKRL